MVPGFSHGLTFWNWLHHLPYFDALKRVRGRSEEKAHILKVLIQRDKSYRGLEDSVRLHIKLFTSNKQTKQRMVKKEEEGGGEEEEEGQGYFS